MIIQDDQKILVIGKSVNTEMYSLVFFAMARLNSDGTVDASFKFSLFPFDSGIFAATNATVDQSGKIIIEGNGIDSIYIVRYNTDGTLDSSFNGNGGLNLSYTFGINAIAVQSDDKIVASLWGSDMKVMRINANGNIDSTFGTDGIQTIVFNGTSLSNAIAIQNDDKIVLGGVAEIMGITVWPWHNSTQMEVLIIYSAPMER